MKSKSIDIALSFSLLSFAAGCGIESSVVGGRCRDGMTLVGDTCVAPTGATLITPTDPPATSASGTVPGKKIADTVVDAPPVVPADEAPPTEVSVTDPIFPLPPPLPPPPLVCDAPLVACHGACIPVQSDPLNCGACGKFCPSNICSDGLCQGAMPGDVVLIGHDYTNAASDSAQAKVLVNAMSIPTTDPVRVLSYEDGAPLGAVEQAKALGSGLHGRSVSYTVAASPTDLASATLGRSYDIVLIHGASAGDPAALGASWATSLGDFTMKGGVVIALDSGDSPVPSLLTSSGLLAVASHAKLASGTHLFVTAAADVVGAQVLSPYAGFGNAVSFQGVAAPSVDLGWVVRSKDDGGAFADPVVVHRIVR